MDEEILGKIELFRRKFHMFSDQSVYPDDRIYLALNLTEQLVSTKQWPDDPDETKSVYWHARFLLAAHSLVLQDNAINDDGTAKANTDTSITGKSVGGISITFDSPSKVSYGQSYTSFDSTTYGREYLTLVRIFGAGCISI